MAEQYNEVTNRLVSTRNADNPAVNHIVTGSDAIYDDNYPLLVNGYIECDTTPISDPTGNPHEQGWCEEEVVGEAGTGRYILTEDTTVELGKSYYKPIGARQNAINKQLRTTINDMDSVVINADEVDKVITSDESKIINKEDGYVPTAGAVGRAMGANFEDNLQSTSTVKGLTANMGRALNETKANKDGWYEQFVSGASLSLIGDDVDEKATFIERETGDSTATGGINHSVDKGTATIDTIYGNTVKWNQLVRASTSAWYFRNSSGTFTISDNSLVLTNLQPSTTGNCIGLKTEFVVGHKYYIRINYAVGSIDSYNRALSAGMSDSPYCYNGRISPFTALNGSSLNGTVSAIGEVPSEHTDWVYFVIMPRSMANTTTLRYKVEITDLTTLEYPNIATTTPTVAEVETWLANNKGTQDYCDYNSGSLISLNPDSLVSKCGYNIFMGNYDTSPQFVSKNYINDTYDVISNSGYNLFKIQVKPSTTYFICSDSNRNLGNSANIRFLDSEGNYISGNNTGKTSPSKSFDTPSNCKYIHFCAYVQFIGNFCINISDIEKNGTYEPYWENEIDLKWITEVKDPTDSTGNRKLFQSGVGNVSGFYDIVTKNILIKKTHEVDLGNISTWYAEWIGTGGFYRYRSSQPEIATISTYNMLICSHYTVSTNDIGVNQQDKSIKIYNGFCIVDSSLSPSDIVNGRIEKLNGIRVRYAIHSPIYVEVSNELNYKVEDGGTESLLPKNASTPTTSALVADIRYPLNALNVIRNLQNNFVPRAELYTLFGSLCTELNKAITIGEFTFDTTSAKFNFTQTENTQSVEEPTETI